MPYLRVYVSQASDEEDTAITIVDDQGNESQLTFDRPYYGWEIGLALARFFPTVVVEFDEIPDL